MTRQHVGFDLLDRVQGHADDNQQGRSSEIEGNIEPSHQNGGQDADGRHIDRSSQRDPGDL